MERERVGRWLKHIVDKRIELQAVVPLKGGMSSSVYRLDTSLGLSLVLRQFTDAAWLRQEPDLVAHEAASLRAARLAGLPAPELVAVDETGEACGCPGVLMTCLEGRVELPASASSAWLRGLAEALAAVHCADVQTGWRFFKYNPTDQLAVPDWTAAPGLWQQAVNRVKQPAPAEKHVFIHRDYHPANVLWSQGAVSGIVDWVNACMGPKGFDAGHCRLNLALLYGVAAADLFLRDYEGAMGERFSYDPYWDLAALTDWLPDRPQVYGGWIALGARHLTDALMLSRMEAYLASVLRR